MTEQTPAAQADNISLELSDIQNAVQIIDFACDQGAFKGWATVEKVLLVRQRLNAFLSAAAAANPVTTEGNPTATPTQDA